MMHIDENALICDFAETYRIYDYKSLPARLAAVYSVGLRENSRIKEKINEEDVPRDIFLQAVIADRLGLICYALSGGKASAPPSLVEMFLGIAEQQGKKETDAMAFLTPEDFQNAWKGGSDAGN